MKFFTTIFLLLAQYVASATNYYVSAAGNNANAGTSEAAPWQTLAKVSSSFSTFAAGDTIFFRRGDEFSGTLTAAASGASGNPIVFAAYGSGAMPILTTFTTLTGWSSIGGNKWTISLAGFDALKILVSGDQYRLMGRFPKLTDANRGYITASSVSGNTSVTGTGLSGYDFTGGEVVIRKMHWVIDRRLITGHSSNTITHTALATHGVSTTYNSQTGYGFFIQNHPSTLTLQNEWSYNATTDVITYYSTSNPDGLTVKAPSAEDLVTINSRQHIKFIGLEFKGANRHLFNLNTGNYVSLVNCKLKWAGENGVYGELSTNFTANGCDISEINSNGVELHSASHNVTLVGNKLSYIGWFPGQGQSGDGSYEAIITDAYSDGAVITDNRIDTIGYNGIGFHGNGCVVDRNRVNYYNFNKDDGAAIYSFVGTGIATFSIRRSVRYNIVSNGVGAPAGTNSSTSQAHGIYMDDNVSQVDIEHNTISFATQSGLYMHNCHDLNVRYNTMYNNTGADVSPEVWFMNDNLTASNITDIDFQYNVLVKTNSQSDNTWVLDMRSYNSSINGFGTINNNVYARPFHSAYFIFTSENSTTDNAYNLSGWKASGRGYDANSNGLPTSIASAGDIVLVTNQTGATGDIPLTAQYMGMDGTAYNEGTINLPNMKGVLLIRTGDLPTPPDNPGTGTSKVGGARKYRIK